MNFIIILFLFDLNIKDFLSYELSLVPPSIAHLSIKQFSIGSTPPVIKAIQVKSYMGAGVHTKNTPHTTATGSTPTSSQPSQQTNSVNNENNKKFVYSFTDFFKSFNFPSVLNFIKEGDHTSSE